MIAAVTLAVLAAPAPIHAALAPLGPGRAALAAPAGGAAAAEEGAAAGGAAETSGGARTADVAPPREALDRALGWLVAQQRPDGGWGTSAPESVFEIGFALETFHAWRFAAHGLATCALAEAPETPERRAALEAAAGWLAEARIPHRGSDWDIDNVWGLSYGFVACVRLAEDPRFAEGELRARIVARGQELYRRLERYQALSGGWAYYDDPPFDRTPTWATSFSTALLLPALDKARADLGWDVDPGVIERAARYVRRCALPNGAYEYDLNPVARLSGVEHINRIEGSLGRIQVCNWALFTLGEPRVDLAVLRAGIDAFFEHHGFLDHVRTRPIPHEGFHANAGYFYFFGHYYAARAIELLPREERAPLHARLAREVSKTLWKSGAASDFLDSHYLVTASTSFVALTLALGLDELEAAR